jgi:hypothetical protein
MMIHHCAFLALRIAQLEIEIATGTMSQHDGDVYLAWISGYRRSVTALFGLRGPEPRPESLGELLRSTELELTDSDTRRHCDIEEEPA